jgi:hypothetical protein
MWNGYANTYAPGNTSPNSDEWMAPFAKGVWNLMWHKFCKWIESLPFANELILIGLKDE